MKTSDSGAILPKVLPGVLAASLLLLTISCTKSNVEKGNQSPTQSSVSLPPQNDGSAAQVPVPQTPSSSANPSARIVNDVLEDRDISVKLTGIRNEAAEEDIDLRISIGGIRPIALGSVEVDGLVQGHSRAASITYWERDELGRARNRLRFYYPNDGDINGSEIDRDMNNESGLVAPNMRPGETVDVSLVNKHHLPIDSLRAKIKVLDEGDRILTIGGVGELRARTPSVQSQTLNIPPVTKGDITATLYDRGIVIKTKGIDYYSDGLQIVINLSVNRKVGIEAVLIEGIINGKTQAANVSWWPAEKSVRSTEFFDSFSDQGLDPKKILEGYNIRERNTVGSTNAMTIVTLSVAGPGVDLRVPSYHYVPMEAARITVLRHDEPNSVFTVTSLDYFRKDMPPNGAREMPKKNP